MAVDHIVVNGVVEEVDDEPFDEQGVSTEERRRCHLVDVDPQSVDLGLQVDKGRRDDGGEVYGFVSVQPALAAGEGEEGFDHLCLLVAGGQYLLRGGTPCGNSRVGVL